MKRNLRARLELTPLIDVMFLVLVFFIYSISEMAVHRGVKVALPDAKGEPERGERAVITIGADDGIAINGIPASIDEAVSRVRAVRSAGMDIPVLVSADRKASLGTGVELLAALKAAGIEATSVQVSGKAK